ncbi:MAG TPA: hypothetical protein VIJ94_10155 [Caulobacteraceae bacterium]
MSWRVLALPLLIALVALAVGWMAPGQPAVPLSVTRYGREPAMQVLQRPDEATIDALPDLTDTLADPAKPAAGPDPDAMAARPPPPPPPPDIAPIFRRQVTAILDEDGQGLAVMLRDPAQDAGQSRLLKVGDKFDHQWRLAGLTTDEAVLQNGRELRRVPLYGGLGGG